MIDRSRTSRDRNHASIKKALERVGCRVHDTAGAGDGFPDLTVWVPRLRRFLLLELKDGDQKRDDLTPHQVKFHHKFRGTDVYIVTSERHALQLIGVDVAAPIAKLHGGRVGTVFTSGPRANQGASPMASPSSRQRTNASVSSGTSDHGGGSSRRGRRTGADEPLSSSPIGHVK